MDLKLILPTKKYKEQIYLYRKNMIDAGSSMDGTGSLREIEDIDVWLKKCDDYRYNRNLPEGRVPATQYICVRTHDNKIVGMLQIRHYLNDYLFNYGGNIGDSVAVDERGKGYGKQLLALGLKKCKKLGLDKVLITCKNTNVASRKCIMANGGKYEDSRSPEGSDVTLERYWIDIK